MVKKRFGLLWRVLTVVVVTLCMFIAMGIEAYAFTPRTSSPESGNKWYFSSANPYYSAGYAYQCTWYAYGRASEILGTNYQQKANGNGGQFWNNRRTDLYSSGSTPKVGAIACCTGGSSVGHVAIVEAIAADGTITFSEYWGSTNDKVIHITKYSSGQAWANGSAGGATFQGYIYLTDGGSNPIGNIDIIYGGAGTITIAGWAFDPDSPNESINVHFYNGTQCIGGCTANTIRTDVNSAYGIGGNHGFECTLSTTLTGNIQVDAYGINLGGGSNALFASGTATVTAKQGSEMTSGYDRVLPDGDYVIALTSTLSSSTFYYLDINGTAAPAEPGTNVIVAGYTGTPTDLPSWEYWTIKYNNGFYTITQTDSSGSIALDLYGSSLANGTNVLAWNASGEKNQQWAISENGNGYRIQSRSNGYSLDNYGGYLTTGNNVQVWEAGNGDSQRWSFIPIERDFTQATFGSISNRIYTGSALTCNPFVYYNGTKLTEGSDYSLSFSNNISVGTATITATGMGNYKGSISATFKILAADLSNTTMTSIGSQTYTGSAIKPKPSLTFNGKTLVEGTDYTLSYSNNTAVGTATVTATGKGNFTGTKSITFQITAANLSSASISSISSQTYTGSAVTPKPTLTFNGKTLVEGTDYTLSYSNNTSVGTATVTATGKGNFTGTKSTTFQITSAPKVDIANASISSISSQTYTGSAITPKPTLAYNGKTLVENTDYTLSYSANINVGTATVTATGKGDYTGTKSITFQISAANLSSVSISSISSQTYTGSAITPKPTLSFNGKTLVEGTDYTLSYSNNTSVGTATVSATGKGNFTGTKSTTFQITSAPKIDLSSVSNTSISAQTYTGNAITPKPTLTYNGKTLVENTDYKLSYSANTNVGTATVTATGKGDYTGTKSITFQISAANLSSASISSIGSQTYTGSAIKPKPTLTFNGKTLVEGTDYTLSYSNNTAVGTATITATGKDNFTGTKSTTFQIVAAAHAPGWAKDNGGYYYYEKDGSLRKSSWIQSGGAWYYLGWDGKLVTNGWATSGGKYYYMGSNGQAKTYSWIQYGGKYYYAGANGTIVVNDWVYSVGNYYYMNASGNPITDNWVKYNNTWYYFNASGVCTKSVAA